MSAGVAPHGSVNLEFVASFPVALSGPTVGLDCRVSGFRRRATAVPSYL